jgi:hypothetical protein
VTISPREDADFGHVFDLDWDAVNARLNGSDSEGGAA